MPAVTKTILAPFITFLISHWLSIAACSPTLGIAPARLMDQTEMTDADHVDDLLQRHCIGEGRNGLLADTSDACRGAVDHDEVVKLVDRVNRARGQLWRWMREQRPELSFDEVRDRWRVAHLTGVVCGGWIEADGGKWDAKSC